MNDYDKEDAPQIVEKVSNTKVKKKQNTRVKNTYYRKRGKTLNTLQETFSTNKSFWVYLWDNMLMKTLVALPLLQFSSSYIKVATLTQATHPCIFIALMLLIRSFWSGRSLEICFPLHPVIIHDS